MNKYNDIEIQTAKNLLENGYMWIVRNETGRLFAHFAKPFRCKVNNVWGSVGFSTSVCDFVPIFHNISSDDKEPVSLESIVHPQILDDVEKRYLSAVIRPFRNEIKSIEKYKNWSNNSECIHFYTKKGDFFYLKDFKLGTMYKGMKAGHCYTLDELGL